MCTQAQARKRKRVRHAYITTILTPYYYYYLTY